MDYTDSEHGQYDLLADEHSWVESMTNHGGARSGAGRKADPNSKIAYTTKLSPQVVAYLRQCDNAAVLIETLIKRTKAFKEFEAKQ